MSLLIALLLSVCSAALPPSLSCSSTGLCFASGLSSGAVLQRAPERAALFGSLLGSAGALVTVRLASTDGAYVRLFNASAAADLTWKVLLEPLPAGGNYSATASCLSGCSAGSTVHATLTDLTFGDVFFCAGQSNMWLPLWFTYTRNTTLASVLAGNYSNIRLWRGGLGKLAAPSHSGNWVGPAGLEPGSDGGEALTNQWRHPYDVATVEIRAGEPWFWEFPATCWYTAQYLTDLLGAEAPPLGLMTVPVGGTMVEEWTAPETQATCRNVTCMCMGTPGCNPYQPLSANCTGNSALWWGNTQPFVNITLRHFLFYQGENSLQYDAGNSAQGTGYACLFPALIAAWRAAWAAVPGTTDPLAPFGFVELADGTDEGWGLSMAALRHAATGSYGGVPNALMPNTYRALAHDAGDQWDADSCAKPNSCCVPTWQALGAQCKGDHRGQWDFWSTNWFQGQVHPRPKAVVGRRLAQAAYATAYGGALLASGPRLAGCALQGGSLRIAFDAALLKGQGITWSSAASTGSETTALYVLPAPAQLPASAGDGHHSGNPRDYQGPFAGGNEGGVSGWVAVNAAVSGPAELTVDLAALGGAAPTAVRYAWGTGGWGAPFLTRMCTGVAKDCSLEPCPAEACPLWAGGLPGEPFLARIQDGKCQCLPPQVC